MTDDSLPVAELARRYLARLDWRRDRAPGPPPPSRTLSIWERWIESDPERAWPLFEEIVRQRPADDEVLEQVWYRLRQLLERHGRTYEARVRAFVGANERLRRIVPAAELDPAAHRPRPLDLPVLVEAYLTMHVHHQDAHELDALIQEDPEVAVELALEIIERGPLHGFRAFDTMDPLLKLLRLHGERVIDHIEAAAAESVLVRRCLWRMEAQQQHPPSEWDVPADVWQRASRARAGATEYNTDEPPGTAHSLAPEHERVVQAWFAYEDAFWAWNRMRDLVEMDPEVAWRALVMLVDAASSPDSLEVIGAGPLEDLLGKHGAAFIDRVEARAASDDAFRDALAAVWQSDMSDEIWERVCRATGKQNP